MRFLALPSFLVLWTFVSAAPRPHPSPRPLPLLIWHGLGDRFDADGLQSTGELAKKVHTGTNVYYIRTDDDGGNDRTNTFFGNLTTQMEDVCEAIHDDPKLRDPDSDSIRVDALGFSQGGQFLRGLLERCEGLSVRSLVTFGSQHNGIAQFQHCGTFDFLCKAATSLVKSNAWSDYVQGKVVPAQYYRTVNETTGLATDEYLEYSNFLADVNNEREDKNKTYAAKIAALEKFVMFVFAEDITVIPKESGWFAEVNATSGEVTLLRDRKMYKEDWLGLKKLDKKDGLVFRTAPGKHMELDDKVLRETFEQYFGPERDQADDHDWELRQLEQLALLADDTSNLDDQQADYLDDPEPNFVYECAAMEAQARWDSLWFWERWRFEWEAVWKPWFRGELTRVSDVEKRLEHPK
jgi:palmitoyl-protein thioesterase